MSPLKMLYFSLTVWCVKKFTWDLGGVVRVGSLVRDLGVTGVGEGPEECRTGVGWGGDGVGWDGGVILVELAQTMFLQTSM